MHKTILLLLLFGISLKGFGQDVFSFQTNHHKDFTACNNGEIQFIFSYTTIPDSFALVINGNRISNGKWTTFKTGKTYFEKLDTGKYNPVLSIYRNGLESKLVLAESLTVLSAPKADFSAKNLYKCPGTKLELNNKSPIDTALIKSWTYSIGDFKTVRYTEKDLVNKWKSDSLNLIKDGYHDLKLVVEKHNGCKDSMIIKDATRVVNPDISVELVNKGNICLNDTVEFKWNKSESIQQFQFVFGDPTSMQNNVETNESNPKHVYMGGPGSYILSLAVLTPFCGAQDTSICCVNINGPSANIPKLAFPILAENNPIFFKSYLKLLNENPDFDTTVKELTYYQRVSGLTIEKNSYGIPKHDVFGDESKIGPRRQMIKYPVVSDSTKIKNTPIIDSFNFKLVKRTWKRGDKIPAHVLYKNPGVSTGLSKYILHDSLVQADPNLDSLTITFPNFSEKRRLANNFGKTGDIAKYFDDNPLDYLHTHPLLSPSYPYASDSLTFFWDFDDDYAQNCVSTKDNPNPYCKFSTEKIPTHIFLENGCFDVALTAKDTTTGCENTSTQAISYLQPKASYDTLKYSEMNFEKQQRIMAKTGSLKGLGIVLQGPSCPGNATNPNYLNILHEGIEPDCFNGAGTSILFDAEQDCKTKIYKKDKNGKIVDSTYIDCNFLNKYTLSLIGNRWSYTTSGWKTVGFVAFNGHNYDTFFYKNYIYIKNTDATFNLKNGLLDSLSQLQLFTLEIENQKNRERDSVTQILLSVKRIAKTNGDGSNGVKEVFAKDTFGIKADGFVDISESKSFNLSPGKYRVETEAKNITSCPMSNAKEVIVGHLSSFRVNQACAGSKTQFIDSVYYWHKGGQAYCELRNWWDNYTCIDTNRFFYSPDNNTARKEWSKYPTYTAPKYKERIAWDFENDGIIDLWGQHNPEHIYNKPGTYVCALWTSDSLGQWQKIVDTVKVPGAKVSVSLADTSQKYICTPDTVQLKVKTDLFYDKIDKITFFGKEYKNQDSFDIYVPILNNQPRKFPLSALTKTGCLDSLQDTNLFTILGPNVSFDRVTDYTICLNEEMVYKNTGDTGKYQWFFNGLPATNQSEFKHTVIAPGHYNDLVLRTTQQLKHPVTNQNLTCSGIYRLKDSLVKQTFVRETSTVSFSISERLENNTISFVVDKINPYFFDNTYTIDGKNPKLLKFQDSLFTIEFPSKGDFELCLFYDSLKCAGTFCLNIWVDDVSINSINPRDIILYPNPTEENITLTFPAVTGKYTLIDLTGRELFNGKLTNGANIINTSSLQAGTYFILIESENNIFKKKLLKN